MLDKLILKTAAVTLLLSIIASLSAVEAAEKRELIYDSGYIDRGEVSVEKVSAFGQVQKCELTIGRKDLGHMSLYFESSDKKHIRMRSSYLYNDDVQWYGVLDGKKDHTSDDRGKQLDENGEAVYTDIDRESISHFIGASTLHLYVRTPTQHGTLYKVEHIHLNGLRSAVRNFYNCIDDNF